VCCIHFRETVQVFECFIHRVFNLHIEFRSNMKRTSTRPGSSQLLKTRHLARRAELESMPPHVANKWQCLKLKNKICSCEQSPNMGKPRVYQRLTQNSISTPWEQLPSTPPGSLRVEFVLEHVQTQNTRTLLDPSRRQKSWTKAITLKGWKLEFVLQL
jgi:hypothetical protein